ncbi:hypothetical protein JG550_003538 [Curtobacterium flaccumfaciens pv. flaccumfaciens]|uniref:MmyB family transcriptional regulator n=1 Tax=Curtobacterium TaxID=2034 RepID=UPI0015E8E559|nr:MULTISPECIES: hypothetical protein [Curtobacterium]MBO9046076.1 hypothetical protein [Curtobacterium flaccumfaciens pv. flaccumfaciens]QTR90769.1 hypothetical protein JG550_003538 [Curtobacterium flaccumfaciens pv. flaccumfaciens]QVG66089.1 hypothetical protein JG551_003571 [Curtobacterium flaccumfaciens pv. flaccumfaciens]
MPQDTDALDRRAKLGQLIGPWTNVPALVYDRHLNVVVSNELAGIVQPTFRVGSNLARAAFLNEELDRSLGDVPVKHARVAAELREALETQGEDAAYVSLVGELASLSDAFARSWADVSGEAPDGVFRFKHARVGTFDLAYHRFRVPGSEGDTLLVWRGADPRSIDALATLRPAERD